jgi:hypothetical protein
LLLLNHLFGHQTVNVDIAVQKVAMGGARYVAAPANKTVLLRLLVSQGAKEKKTRNRNRSNRKNRKTRKNKIDKQKGQKGQKERKKGREKKKEEGMGQ